MVSFTLDDYASISFSNNEQDILSPEVLSIITRLTQELNISETLVTKSNVVDSSKLSSRRPRTNKPGIDITWEKCKTFKATTIEKKEGIEKNMNDIRISLNKLSESNYEITRDDIITTLKELTDEALRKVAEMIFDIASTNQYFSELYAVLYKELIEQFSIFETILDDMIKTRYLEQLDKIMNIDMESNFDAYCDNQKLNDKRKALSAFLVNLLKTDVYDMSKILEIMRNIIERVDSIKDEPDRLFEVEELTENIFIITTRITENAGHELKEKEQENADYEKKEKKKNKNKNDESAKLKHKEMNGAIKHVLNSAKYNRIELFRTESWRTIIDKLQMCSQYVAKEHISISSRVVFRYKDIMDNIKKNGGV
jgi:MIF4G domain